MIQFVIKAFNELTPTELYQLLQLRAEVFIVEQNCPYLDLDNKDDISYHVLGFEQTKLVAYARLVPAGISYKEPSIGRVVTHPSVRKSGYGKLLMDFCITEIKKQFNANDIVISAQLYLEKFYTHLGFAKESDMYLEDNIPHIQMRHKN